MADEAGLFVGPAYQPDQYRLVELVGQGAQGEVWRAVEEGQVVALKRYVPAGRMGAEQHLKNLEAMVLARMPRDEPYLGSLVSSFAGPVPHPLGQWDGDRAHYAVFRWVDGEPLNRWLEGNRGDLTPLRTVAHGLQALHRNGLVHADVRPANILVEGGATAVGRLIDLDMCQRIGMAPTLLAGQGGYWDADIQNGVRPAADFYSLARCAVRAAFNDEWARHPNVADIREAIASAYGATVAEAIALALSHEVADGTDIGEWFACLGPWPGGQGGPPVPEVPTVLEDTTPEDGDATPPIDGTVPQPPGGAGPIRVGRPKRQRRAGQQNAIDTFRELAYDAQLMLCHNGPFFLAAVMVGLLGLAVGVTLRNAL